MKRRVGAEDEGFSLIEVAIAAAIFMMVSLGFMTTMIASVETYDSARDRTLGQQVASQQLEQARRMSWDQLGVVGGNPQGLIAPSKQVTVGGLTFTVVTTVAYVDDPVPNGISTGANYKRVTVTVTSSGAGSKPYTSETLIAPPTQPSLNSGVISAQIRDYFDSSAIAGASIQILTGPSATRSDVSDTAGNAKFPSLTPTPLTGPQAFYDVVASVSGYAVWPQDVVPAPIVHFALDPGAAPIATIRMYKPGTIIVAVRDYLGNLTGRAGTAVLTSAAGRGTATVALSGGKATFTQTTTSAPASVSTALIWNENYSVKVTMSDGTVLTSTAAPIANLYTDSLTSTITLQLPSPPLGTLKVLVRSTGLGTPPLPAGVVVTATGGPEVVTLSAPTDATGTATLSLPGSSTVGYTISVPAGAPYGAGSKSLTVPANATTNTNLDVSGPAANTTLQVRLRSAGLGNPLITGATITLTGGPTSVNMTAPTDLVTGVATFTVPATNTVVYTASVAAAAPYGAGSVTSVALPAVTTSVDLTVSGPPANGTLQVRLRSTGTGSPAIPGSTITLTGGPTNVNLTAVTDINGLATFNNNLPATDTTPYTASVAASGVYGAGSVTSLVAPNATTTANLNVSGP